MAERHNTTRVPEGRAAWIGAIAGILLVVLGYLGLAATAHWWPFGTPNGRSSAAGALGARQPASPPVANRGWSVYWSGPVGINGNGLNFDNKPPSSASADTYFNGSLTSTGATMAPWPGPGTPTAASCQAWVTTHPDSSVGTVTTGMQICLLTTQGRSVLLHIQRLPSSTTSDLQARATIWQRGSLASSSSSSTPASAVASRWGAYWSGPVGINGNGLNFDNKPPSSASADTYFNGSLTSTGATMAPWPGPGTPTAAQCQTWVTTHPDSSVGTVTTGMQICLLTTQGRSVLLHIQRLPSSTTSDLQAHATIWEQQ